MLQKDPEKKSLLKKTHDFERFCFKTSLQQFKDEQERARSFLVKNSQYDLVDDDVEEASIEEEKDTKKNKKLRRKRTRSNEDAMDEALTVQNRFERPKKEWEEDSETEITSDMERVGRFFDAFSMFL